MSRSIVLFLVLTASPSALAGVWVGTPVSVRLASTSGLVVSQAKLAFDGARLVPCAGGAQPLPDGPFQVSDAVADFHVPAGCWQALELPVAWLAVDGLGPSSSTFALDIDGWGVSIPLGGSSGAPVTLVIGEPDWVSQSLLALQPDEDRWIGPGHVLHAPIRASLAEEAGLY